MDKLIIKFLGLAVSLWAIVQPRKAAAKALDLFSTPRAGQHKDYHADYLRVFEKAVVPSAWGDIAVYRRAGDGPRVLFCHGWESNAFRWRKVLKYLEDESYDIYLMEAPAHGASGGSRFTAIYYAEGMRDVIKTFHPHVIVGHSVGGFALCYAAEMGWLTGIQRAIIMAPPDTLELITDNYFNLLGYSSRVRRYYDQLITERFGKPTTYYNASSFAQQLDMPGVVIHDVDDDINRYFEGEAVANGWPQGDLITTRGLGHSLQGEEVYSDIARQLELTVGEA
jgi:pimeloyl-ACP methyl ester carboxylesterase